MLRHEFMRPLGLSSEALAAELGVKPLLVESVLQGLHPIRRALARKLGQRFGTTAMFWLNLQDEYERCPAEARLVRAISEEVSQPEDRIRRSLEQAGDGRTRPAADVGQMLALARGRLAAMALLLEMEPDELANLLDRLVWETGLAKGAVREAAKPGIEVTEVAGDLSDRVAQISANTGRRTAQVLKEALRLGLRSLERDIVAESLGDGLLEPYDWGDVDPLTAGQPLIRTPELARAETNLHDMIAVVRAAATAADGDLERALAWLDQPIPDFGRSPLQLVAAGEAATVHRFLSSIV